MDDDTTVVRRGGVAKRRLGYARGAMQIEPFDAAHLDGIVECVTAVWSEHNVIARALGVTADEYRPVAERMCRAALASGMGLMLREPRADRVMGFHICGDLVDELPAEAHKEQHGTPRMQRWAALLSRGLRWYLDRYHAQQPLRRGEVFYMDIGGTRPELRGDGWSSRMIVQAALTLAVPRGYQRLLAIATHPHSVHKARTTPGATNHEIRFADLEDPDLSKITEPDAVIVSVMPLPSRPTG